MTHSRKPHAPLNTVVELVPGRRVSPDQPVDRMTQALDRAQREGVRVRPEDLDPPALPHEGSHPSFGATAEGADSPASGGRIAQALARSARAAGTALLRSELPPARRADAGADLAFREVPGFIRRLLGRGR